MYSQVVRARVSHYRPLSSLLSTARLLRALQRTMVEHVQALRRQQLWQEKGVEIAPTALVRIAPGAKLEIGAGTVIGPYSVVDLLADPRTSGPSTSRVSIGRGVAVNEFSNIRAGGGEIVIGDGCMISQYVSIIGSNHSMLAGVPMRDQPWEAGRRRVTIGEDVWLGTHVVVLPGVCIGSGCVVGAGAVVTSDVADGLIVAGVPAREIGRR